MSQLDMGGAGMTNVAVIGAGLIGRAWAIVFARAGFTVTLWDQFPQQVTAAMRFIHDRLPELRSAGLLADEPDVVLARVKPVASMWDAVRSADYIQENGPERADVKQVLFTELERAARPEAVIGSSSSGIPASASKKARSTWNSKEQKTVEAVKTTRS